MLELFLLVAFFVFIYNLFFGNKKIKSINRNSGMYGSC